MAWTAPKAWVDQDLVTADDLNEQLSGNLEYLYGALPAARVYNSGSISIPDGTTTALTFDTERYDNDSIYDNAPYPSRLTCKTAGKYLIACHVVFYTNTSGYRKVQIRVNGATNIAMQTAIPGAGSNDTSLSVATIYDLAVNDYVEVMVVQNSGGALSVRYLGNYSPEFSMNRVG